MKAMKKFKYVLIAFVLCVIASPDVLATGIAEAEEQLNQALKNLKNEVERRREAFEDPKHHETSDELNRLQREVEKAANKLDEARIQQELDEKKRIARERNAEKKAMAETESVRNERIRSALKDKAQKARDAAKAKDNEDKDYDKAMEELEKANAEAEKARAHKAAEENLDQKEADLKNAQDNYDKEKNKRTPNAVKLAELERILNEAKKARDNAKKASDDAKKPNGNEQSALPERGNHKVVATISIGGMYTLDRPSPQFITPETFYHRLSSPEIYADLYESLGGEFIIGALTNLGFTGVEMPGRHHLIPGLGIGLNFLSGLEVGIQFNRFNTDWSGSFPYTVFPFEGTSSQTLRGSVSRSVSGIMTDIDARYFFSRGKIRPYLSAGVRGQWIFNDQTSVNMGSASFSLESSPLIGNKFSPYFGAGARLDIGQNVFVQTGVSFANMPGHDYSPNVHVAVGWKFHNSDASLLALNGQKNIVPKKRSLTEGAKWARPGKKNINGQKNIVPKKRSLTEGAKWARPGKKNINGQKNIIPKKRRY